MAVFNAGYNVDNFPNTQNLKKKLLCLFKINYIVLKKIDQKHLLHYWNYSMRHQFTVATFNYRQSQ